jgi:hypothetical protein
MGRLLILTLVIIANCAFAEEPVEVVSVEAPEAPAAVPAEKPTAMPRNKFGKHDVELRLRDGSVIRGQLKGLDQVSLKTSFGTLKIPLEDLRTISHTAARSESKAISEAIAQLKGKASSSDKSAEQILEQQGVAAVDALFDARSGATAEVKIRIDALLKRILQASESIQVTGDIVKAAKFEARGTLQLESIQLNSKLGELTVKLSDLETIRWLSAGDSRMIELDAIAAMKDWVDTGMDLVHGQSVSFKCTGTANLLGSYNSTANGNPQWNNNGQFLIGCVIGKLGPDGDPFRIGEENSFKAETSSRLYVKIFCSDDVFQSTGRRSSGHYTLSISSGSLEGAEKTGN